MKKLSTLTIICCLLGLQAFAQTRNINLEVTLVAPQNKDTVTLGKQFNITTKIKNLGTDTVIVTDTLEYRVSIDGHHILFAPNLADYMPYGAMYILPGDSTYINFKVGLAQGYTVGNYQLCTSITTRSITDTVIDSDTINNKSCATLYAQDSTVSIGYTTVLVNNIRVYPNPASNTAHLQLALQQTTDLTISMRDMLGRLVYQHQYLQQTSGKHQLPLPVGELPKGCYLYQVQVGKEIKTGKLLID